MEAPDKVYTAVIWPPYIDATMPSLTRTCGIMKVNFENSWSSFRLPALSQHKRSQRAIVFVEENLYEKDGEHP